MFASERREAILAMIFERGNARTVDLAKTLGVSEVTIRTDLEVLEDQGRVSRVHGGATMPEEPLVGFDQRSTRRVEAKQRIAAAAVKLIEDGMTIVLDSGTTSFALARQLPTVNDLVVLTPGINIALRLMDVKGVDLRLLGGRIVPRIAATVGSQKQQGLEGAIAHIAFLGAGGIDADNDIVEGAFDIADSKRSIGSIARRKVLLADASKWDTTDRHKVLNVTDFDVVITDEEMAPELRESIRAAGVELIVV